MKASLKRWCDMPLGEMSADVGTVEASRHPWMKGLIYIYNIYIYVHINYIYIYINYIYIHINYIYIYQLYIYIYRLIIYIY